MIMTDYRVVLIYIIYSETIINNHTNINVDNEVAISPSEDIMSPPTLSTISTLSGNSVSSRKEKNFHFRLHY